jgi:hypothetical protein
MKLLAGRAIDQPCSGREVLFHEFDQVALQIRDGMEPHDVNAGQPFAKGCVIQDFTHPVRKIIRRFRSKVMVGLEKAVGVVVNGRPRGLTNPLEEFRE